MMGKGRKLGKVNLTKVKKWCSVHQSTTQTNTECYTQQRKDSTSNAAHGAESDSDEYRGSYVSNATDENATKPSGNENMMTLLVDSGVSGHVVDSDLVDGVEDPLTNFADRKQPYEIQTAGRNVLYGVATGALSGSSWEQTSTK